MFGGEGHSHICIDTLFQIIDAVGGECTAEKRLMQEPVVKIGSVAVHDDYVLPLAALVSIWQQVQLPEFQEDVVAASAVFLMQRPAAVFAVAEVAAADRAGRAERAVAAGQQKC